MARRCPDAVDPRPAMLADHDWLINERGVATVEPFAGNRCTVCSGRFRPRPGHLDSAEGVPVRYRRDRLTVHTDDGPVAGLGVHRPSGEPGSAAAGLSAAHHRRRSPPRAAATLDRVSAPLGPARWPRPLACRRLAPQSLSELLSEPGVIEVSRLRSRFGFLAIHGGGLEQMTDVIAERAAEAAGASVYLLRHPDRLSAPPAVGAISSRGVGAARRIPRPRRRRGVAARLRPDRAQHPAAGRRPQPRAGRAPGAGTSSCPAIRSSPISTPFRANCAACIRTTRSTGCAAAGRSWNCRAGPGYQPAQPAARRDGLSPVTPPWSQGLVAAARSRGVMSPAPPIRPDCRVRIPGVKRTPRLADPGLRVSTAQGSPIFAACR